MSWVPLQHLLLAQPAGRPVAVAPAMDHAAFASRCLHMAGALQASSTKRAGLWFDDAAELAIALLACWRAGVTAVLAGDIQPHTVAALDVDLDCWISDKPLNVLPPERVLTLSDSLKQTPMAAAALKLDIAGIELCTSGSSGQPKRIIKQWAQLSHEIEALESQWQWSHLPACVLGSVSAQHMYGLPFRVLWPLCSGRSIARHQLIYPEDIEAATLQYPQAVWITSPALLRRLGDGLQWSRLSAKISQIFSSGGALPDELFDVLHTRLDRRPTEIYGSSETGAIAWRQSSANWQPLPKVALDRACNGALRARAPWIASDDEQTADAVQLQDGCFTLLGRLDRIVKIEEKRVALPMLEQALIGHSCVREARVGRATGASRLTALVALSPTGLHRLRNGGRKALIQDLHQYFSDRFESLAIPRSWRFLAHLPWTTQNKLPQDVFDLEAGPRPLTPVVHTLAADHAYERRYTLNIPPDLACFAGHFKDTPVVPGVALIGWAMKLTHQDLQPALVFGGMEALKFQRLIRPGDVVNLHLRWDESRGKLYFDYRADDVSCASGRIVTAR